MTEDGKYLILSVEDNKENQLQLIKLLNKYNDEFKVMAAPDGLIALKILEKYTPDLILMDWEMPNMDGVTCLKIIRKNDITKHIPVIMVTGMSYKEDIQIALDEGANDYVKKPYGENEMIIRIRKVLNE
jgi:CheY-like chemotaxis protein